LIHTTKNFFLSGLSLTEQELILVEDKLKKLNGTLYKGFEDERESVRLEALTMLKQFLNEKLSKCHLTSRKKHFGTASIY
jgi:hypothetical protein